MHICICSGLCYYGKDSFKIWYTGWYGIGNDGEQKCGQKTKVEKRKLTFFYLHVLGP
jgi:hypothetical protein